MAPDQQYTVVNGPSKWDLSLSLFDRAFERAVNFEINCPVPTTVAVCITSVQAEDGSGESWNLEGGVAGVRREKKGEIRFPAPAVGERVKLFFRTDKRQGHAQFI